MVDNVTIADLSGSIIVATMDEILDAADDAVAHRCVTSALLRARRAPVRGQPWLRVDAETARDAVRVILDETMKIRIDWGEKTLIDIGHELKSVMHERHPGLTAAALKKLGDYFTYLVK